MSTARSILIWKTYRRIYFYLEPIIIAQHALFLTT